MKNILITNDDGINSPGLQSAANALYGLGKITIVAPTKQQTGMGRSLQGNGDGYFQPIEYFINGEKTLAYHCECSPALIVQHCLNTIFAKGIPDLIVSGINYGENVGFNITQSGTIGAALEGASLGIPAIAISLQTKINQHHSYDALNWDASMHFLKYFSKRFINRKFPGVDVLKVDVPSNATEKTPWKITNLARSPYYCTSIENPTISSKITDVKLQIKYNNLAKNNNSDISVLIEEKTVSVTPLSLDFTSNVNFDKLKQSLEY